MNTSNFANVSPLGVGLNYQKSFKPLFDNSREFIDFIEISPDTLCHNRTETVDGVTRPVLHLNPRLLTECLDTIADYPVSVHGLGLSIGSASGMNTGYLEMLDAFGCLSDYHWHSEHLGFTEIVTVEGEYLHAGTQLPVPFTRDVANMLMERIQQLQARYQRPFLLENTTYYLPDLPADGMDEIDFLNLLTRETGCGLVLDLYNFHCNAMNFGFDPYSLLAKLDMSAVVEIHIAGGASHKGLQLDVHSREVPAPVWDLLEWVLNRAPNVKAVLYELLEQAYGALGPQMVMTQLLKARGIWQQTTRVRDCDYHGGLIRGAA